jgi:hypothetical protein
MAVRFILGSSGTFSRFGMLRQEKNLATPHISVK